MELEEEFTNLIEEIRPMKLQDRPMLVKITKSIEVKKLINKINTIIQENTESNITLTEINVTHYAAALLIQEKLYPTTNEKPEQRYGNPEESQDGK